MSERHPCFLSMRLRQCHHRLGKADRYWNPWETRPRSVVQQGANVLREMVGSKRALDKMAAYDLLRFPDGSQAYPLIPAHQQLQVGLKLLVGICRQLGNPCSRERLFYLVYRFIQCAPGRPAW